MKSPPIANLQNVITNTADRNYGRQIMHASDKIVDKIPLDKIWTSDNELVAKRSSYLTKDAITNILKKYPVTFIIANCGDKLKWVDTNKCYDFWKSQAKEHIADNITHIDLNTFPDNYAYIASEWTGEIQNPIILLEKVH